MLRRKISTTLLVCGALLVLSGLTTWPAEGAVPARPLAQPSPRPTLNPTATSAAPTATAVGPSGESKSHAHDASSQPGRITGTIIELNSGAPTPGIAVNVGGVMVSSDANGNYDHWLAPGSYQVALALAPEQGTPAQGPQTVDLAPGGTVVLHLSFRGPLPTTTPAPTAATPAIAGGTSAHPPTRLPVTGEQPRSAWLWLLIGAMLLAMGGALEIRGARVRALLPASAHRFSRAMKVEQIRRPAERAREDDSASLLAALLTADPRPAPHPTRADDDLLAALLREETRKLS